MAGDILENDPFQPVAELARDPRNIRPEVAFVLGSLSLSRLAKGLAGVSGEQGVDASCPWPCVKGGEIAPDRGGGKVSSALGGNEGAPGVFLPFDKASGVIARLREEKTHVEAASACAER